MTNDRFPMTKILDSRLRGNDKEKGGNDKSKLAIGQRV